MQLTPDGVLAGYVMLNLTGKGYETGPHRGEVEKLLVHPNFRRMGVAKRVMGLLEEAAREEGTWLLVRIFDFGVRGSGEELMRRHSNSIRKKDRRRRRFTPAWAGRGWGRDQIMASRLKTEVSKLRFSSTRICVRVHR